MTAIYTHDVLRVLQQAPQGLTTAQIAERLSLDRPKRIVSRLSRLADYGLIERERHHGPKRSNPSHWCIWKAKG